MMGTAAANPADMDLVINGANYITITPDNSSITTSDVLVYNIDYATFTDTHNRTITACTTDSNLYIKIVGNGADTGWTNNALASSSYVAIYNNSYTFDVYVKGTVEAEIHVYDNAGQTYISSETTACDSASASANIDVPEFPTIALPVAAILGLAFIFQRRRKEE